MWHPIKINLHECGLEAGGCGFGAVVPGVAVPEASGKQVRKQASLKAAQACVGSGLARGRQAGPEARKRYDGELSGESESNRKILYAAQQQRDVFRRERVCERYM